jgi:hypothetical protein
VLNGIPEDAAQNGLVILNSLDASTTEMSGPYNFGVGVNNEAISQGMAAAVQGRSVALVYEPADIFLARRRTEIRQAGVQVVADTPLEQANAQALVQSGAQAMIFLSWAPVQLIRDVRNAGFRGPIVGPDSFDNAFAANVGAPANQSLYGMGFLHQGQLADFVPLMGNDAAVALVAALEQSGGEVGAPLQRALLDLRNVAQTQSGVSIAGGVPITMNGQGVHTGSMESLFVFNGSQMEPVPGGIAR